jgi:cation transporter-like permease
LLPIKLLQVLFEMIDGSLHLHVGDFRWDTDTIVSMNPVLAALKASCGDAATANNATTTHMQAQQQITRRCFDTQTATLHVHYSSF